MALTLLGLSAAGFAVVQPGRAADPAVSAPVLPPVYVAPAETVTEDVVRRGETLSEVFARASLGRSELNDLMLALPEHLDPRRILPNTVIRVHRWAADGATRAVDLALNADSTVRLTHEAVGWTGEVRVTPTTVDTVYASGRLGDGGSLYATLLNDDRLAIPRQDREALVWQLARIYGWEVDFAHDMQPGDSYRVAYERHVRPDGTSRDARVLVAEIVNQGRTIPAIFFDPEGNGGDYFNADGQSLRLAFLRYPVDYPRITSTFSWRRYHPVLKRSRPHLGTDFGAAVGTPVHSTADGVIVSASWDGGYGNLVRINHGNGYETRYAHLSRFAPGIHKGVRVKQGQLIAYSGNTGLTTGPHVHYELRRFGQAMNPRKVRLPSAPPVPARYREAFHEVAQHQEQLLASVPIPPTHALPAN